MFDFEEILQKLVKNQEETLIFSIEKKIELLLEAKKIICSKPGFFTYDQNKSPDEIVFSDSPDIGLIRFIDTVEKIIELG